MFRTAAPLAFCLFLAVSLTACRGSSGLDLSQEPAPQGLPQAWNTASGDATQSGYFDWEGPDSASLDWIDELNPILFPLLADQDGTLYCNAGSGIVALAANGDILWRYTGPRPVYNSFSMSADGLLHYIGSDRSLITLRPDGSVVNAVDSALAGYHCVFDSLGRPYLQSKDEMNDNGILAALDIEGNERWRFPSSSGNQLSIYLEYDRVYCLEDNNSLTAIDMDGNLLWSRTSETDQINCTIATRDGRCFIQWYAEEFPYEVVSPQGQTMFRGTLERMRNEYFGNYCGKDNELYLNTTDFQLLRLDPDGHLTHLRDNVRELAEVSPDCYKVLVLNTAADSTWSSIEVLDPDNNSLGTIDQDRYPQQVFTGYSGCFYTTDTSRILTAYSCTMGPIKAWEYRNTESQHALTIGAEGRATVIDWSGIWSYADGVDGAVDFLTLPIELHSFQSVRYRGHLTAGSCDLVSYNDTLYAINSDGQISWSFTMDNPCRKCLPSGGQILLIDGSHFSILDQQGAEVFSLENPAIEDNSSLESFVDLAAGYDGRIYLLDSAGNVIELSPDGTINWSLSHLDDRCDSLMVAGNNLLLVQTNNKLYGITRSGSLHWEYSESNWGLGKPAYSPKGVIYLPYYHFTSVMDPAIGYQQNPGGTANESEEETSAKLSAQSGAKELILLTEHGELINKVELPYPTRRQPLVDARGIAYLTDYGMGMTAVEPTGRIAWRYDFSEHVGRTTASFLVAPVPTGGLMLANKDYVIKLGD